MIRKIIKINEEKCNGCGLCAKACHEGAIGMVNGKAKLLREDYCDGLGDCLPACPMDAITFEEREAPAYNEAAVLAAKKQKTALTPGGCPGSAAKAIRPAGSCPGSRAVTLTPCNEAAPAAPAASQLQQWPVQIKLAPINAPYFNGCHLLIAADCTAYAYGNFHQDFIRGKVTLIGCPKLDEGDYTEKLTAILTQNDVRSITVARMTVPCCGGIQRAVQAAAAACGKDIPLHVAIIAPDGTLQ